MTKEKFIKLINPYVKSDCMDLIIGYCERLDKATRHRYPSDYTVYDYILWNIKLEAQKGFNHLREELEYMVLNPDAVHYGVDIFNLCNAAINW